MSKMSIAVSVAVERLALIAVLALSLVMAVTLPALADHEPDHRFKLTGVVSGPDGRPLGGAAVQVAVPSAGIQVKRFTDGRGRYSADLHLHDQDASQPIFVTVGGLKVERKLSFDPQDKKSERKMRIDLSFQRDGDSTGDPAADLADVERRSTFWSDYGFFIFLGLSTVAALGILIGRRVRSGRTAAGSPKKGDTPVSAGRKKSGQKSGKKPKKKQQGGRRRR